MSLMDTEPGSATVSARTDCKLAPDSERRVVFLVNQTLYFEIEVMRVMAERLRRRNAQA
jgi:CRP/FNR family cyclic AMP-dependent transcriptional regulator